MTQTNEPVFIIFECQAKPDSVDTVKRLLLERFPATRVFPGYVELTAYVDDADGRTVTLVQKWASRDAYQKYFEWRSETGDIQDFMQYVEGKPSVRFFTPLEA